jgi:hypothetical protein
MKKFLVVLILCLVALVPAVLAEAVDAVPEITELMTKEVLATMAGMVILTAILTQGIKMLFLPNAETKTTRTMAFIVAAVVTVMGKLIFSLPFEIADILILPGNAVLIWWASMKGYEQFFGKPTTPAGNATNGIH